jgi:hypothetical protein
MHGIIPNSIIVDFSKSPHGRFTNGYNWVDFTCAYLVNEFQTKHLEESLNLSAADLADDVEDDDPKVEPEVQAEKTLEEDTKVDEEGERFARTFCEGGLTSHNYSHEWILNIKCMGARKFVSNLDEKRGLLFESDKKLAISKDEKSKTIVIECSGGNDLLTVNPNPTNEIADIAIAARIENVKKLYEAGYRNFVLGNLANLALTPRLQNMTKQDRDIAKKVSKHFNQKLIDECKKLKNECPDLSIHIFDTYSTLDNIYKNPGKFGFDEDKKNLQYTKSADFNLADGVSTAPGYMFWDDIHPTANLHARLGEIFSTFIKSIKEYKFQAPPKSDATSPRFMVETFLKKYHEKLNSDKTSPWSAFGMWDTTKSKLSHDAIESEDDYPRILADILYHGINEGGDRTRQILLELEWIDSNNNINFSNTGLYQAKQFYDNKSPKSPSVH